MALLDLDTLAPAISDLARIAGAKIMEIYATDFEARVKDDASPVTEADLAAEAIILKGLKDLTPDIPIVAEEAVSGGETPDISGGVFWLVDPVDGTKEFLNRNGEFTVNIGLIKNGLPVLGVVFAPALDQLYLGVVGQGATLSEGNASPKLISTRPLPGEGLTVIASRRHGDPAEIERHLSGHPIANMKSTGSSLKFCVLARGDADVYPRFGRTMEWDTAAGHAVLAAAGGRVETEDGHPFTYAKNAIFENPYFIAWGGA